MRQLTVLLAEDDEDDRLLARQAWREVEHDGQSVEVRCVEDGAQLLDYLRVQGAFAPPTHAPRPDLILLDLHMPRLDGRAALRQIKSDPSLRAIPVVVLTTSSAPADVWNSYQDGANSYITKPASFEKLVETLRDLRRYWAEIVQLPEPFSPGMVPF